MRSRWLLRAALAAALVAAAVPSTRSALAAPAEDYRPPDAGLTGADIYRRVINNRFTAFSQDVTLTSGDRGGNEQHSKLHMKWVDMHDAEDKPTEGYLSKTLVVYTEPFDLRYTAYLVLQRNDPPNDQFVYMPSRRRVRRVNLRGETIFGTDFSFEDIIPREFESADYVRRPDEMFEDVPCFVVEATPKPEQNSEYSKFLLYVDKKRNVPLKIRYWDMAGIEVKELISPPSSVKEFDGVFVPMKATIRNLQQDSYSVGEIDKLEPNPPISKSVFDPRRLEGH
jgi:Outer membrane lipoprotein-sorting protein